MTTTTSPLDTHTDWVGIVRTLGPAFASRAAALDANDTFAAQNFEELKEKRVLSAGIPAELGGGGASHAELCTMLRELGRHCGATALALSMHLHLVATSVWQHRQGIPVAPLLERVATEQLMLVTSGASDWLDSSGTAEAVDGGFLLRARKHFVSGSPAGDLFVTSAVYDDPAEGPTVLHFSVPMKAQGVTVLDNWRTMGMRASGSNDVALDGVFVPAEAVVSRRPRGTFPAIFNAVAPIANSLIMSAYLGVAEAARTVALDHAAKRRDDPNVWYLLGEMENAFAAGELAVHAAIDLCAEYAFEPGPATVNAAMVRRTIAGDAFRAVAEKAMEAVGGAAFFRSGGLERSVRDLQASRFHPLPPKRQHRFTGRFALGLDPVG